MKASVCLKMTRTCEKRGRSVSKIPVLKAREDVIRLKGKKITFELNLQKHQALDLKRYEGEKATCFVSWMENLPMSFASPHLVYLDSMLVVY